MVDPTSRAAAGSLEADEQASSVAGRPSGRLRRTVSHVFSRPLEGVTSSTLGLLLAALAVVFVSETLVMQFLMPALVPHQHGFPGAIIDASIMASLSAPFLWWLIARRHRAEQALRVLERVTSSTSGLLLAALAVVYVAETLVMWFLMPALVPHKHGFLGATIDASIMASLSTPFLWWLIARQHRAEQALRVSEARYRSLAENTFDLVLEAGADARFSYASPNYRDVLGYEPGELLGTSVFDPMHPDDRPAVMQEFARAMSTPGPGTATFRYRHKNGEWRWFESIGKPFRSASGDLHAVIISRDVTERRQADNALRESEERFRKIFEEGPLGMAVVGLDYHFVKVNAALCAMVGYSDAELTSLTFPDITHPDDIDADVRLAERLLQGDIPSYRMDKRYIRKDGQIIWITLTGSIIRNKDGEAMHYLAMIQDITERKHMEEALRESEEQTRLIVETAYDALISMDSGGVITAWNGAAEATFGWSREEAIGRTLADTIVPEQLREAHVEGLKRFLATGEGPVLNKRIEITAVRRDGHVFPVELAVWAVASADGSTFNAFVHDISERKRAEEALRTLNQELEAERQQVESLNRSLEKKVRGRTQDLHLANEELKERNRQLLNVRAQAATDALTGLPNHRAFQERIRDEVHRAEAEGSSVGLIMLDIDGFKGVNDSLGHLEGDRLLRGLALTLAEAVGQDCAYRYGGDEFVVLLPKADRRTTGATAERVRRAVEASLDVSGEKLTISLGVASFPHSAGSAEELIYGADAAMYWAKSAGKNRVGDWSGLVQHRTDGTLPWYAADRGVKAPDVVAALVAALAAKDPVTSAHSQRCSWYALRLAEELGLDAQQTPVVRLASLLHDIGKLAVPDEVLLKPGPLSTEEWAHIKRHPTAAIHILGHVRPIADATAAVLHHHEHFDGSGYPDGLAGEEIPMASRILLVTDAFDAMTTDRPYRKAMSIEAAIEQLKCCSGSQFDPVVVEAFLRVLSRHGAQPLRRMAATQAVPVATRGGGRSVH